VHAEEKLLPDAVREKLLPSASVAIMKKQNADERMCNRRRQNPEENIKEVNII